MGRAEYTFRRPDESCAEEIAELFANVFTQELWNDDWSDREQLRHYIHDLTGQGNSLTFGLYQDEELVGVSMAGCSTGMRAWNTAWTNSACAPAARGRVWALCWWRR